MKILKAQFVIPLIALLAVCTFVFAFQSAPAPVATGPLHYFYTIPQGFAANALSNGEQPVLNAGIQQYNVYYEVRDQYGNLLASGEGHNLITTSGLDWAINQMFPIGAATCNTTEKAVYIALSTNTTAVSATWVANPDEVTGNGLDKAIGTVAHAANANHTVIKVFTATGTQEGITKAALCYAAAASCGYDLYAIAELSPSVNMGNGDTLTLTWVNTATS